MLGFSLPGAFFLLMNTSEEHTPFLLLISLYATIVYYNDKRLTVCYCQFFSVFVWFTNVFHKPLYFTQSEKIKPRLVFS